MADRTEGRDQVPRLSPRHLPARQQRGVPPGDLPRRVPHQRVDRAARPRARRLRSRVEDGRGPAGVHGGARGGTAPREPHLARRDPQRTVAGTVGRPRRPTRARDHRAFGVLQGLPGGSRLSHAGLRGAASGGGVAAGLRAGRRARSRLARPLERTRGPPLDRRAGGHERGQAARCPGGGRDPASRRCARRDRGPAHRGLRRPARDRRREGRRSGERVRRRRRRRFPGMARRRRRRRRPPVPASRRGQRIAGPCDAGRQAHGGERHRHLPGHPRRLRAARRGRSRRSIGARPAAAHAAGGRRAPRAHGGGRCRAHA